MGVGEAGATGLLQQAGGDPARRDGAESFIMRRVLETEHASSRIEENAEGRLERDARVLARASG